MARYSVQEAQDLLPSNIGYFSLKEDGDVAPVRILYSRPSDIEIVSVHRVMVKGRERNIECAKEHKEDADEVCPLCASGAKVGYRIFVPVFDIEENAVKIWEKGGTFYKKLDPYFMRTDKLWEEIIEVKRHGRGEDRNPTYSLSLITGEYADTDSIHDFDIEEVEIPDISDANSYLLIKKTPEQMRYFLEHGMFEDDDGGRQGRNNGGGQQPEQQQGAYRRRGGEQQAPSTGYSSRLGGSSTPPRSNARREF